MMKHKALPLVFRSLYLLIGVIGILASLGVFDGAFREDFYLPFTHLSNYACIVLIACHAVLTVCKPSKRTQTVMSLLRFMGLAAILLTFTVFHLLLAPAPNRDPALNYTPVSILFHVVLPLMYVADWAVFTEHGRLRWYAPLLSVLTPLMYVIFVYLRAAAYSFDSAQARLYPYFFLDPDSRSVPAVGGWMVLLLIGYLIMGYGLFGMDRLLARIQHKKRRLR